MSTNLAPRLKGRYKSEIAPALKSKFGYKNSMQIPTLTKVVVNMGVGEAARDSKLSEPRYVRVGRVREPRHRPLADSGDGTCGTSLDR